MEDLLAAFGKQQLEPQSEPLSLPQSCPHCHLQVDQGVVVDDASGVREYAYDAEAEGESYDDERSSEQLNSLLSHNAITDPCATLQVNPSCTPPMA